MLKHILAAAAALALAAPVAAQAQSVPSYAYAPQTDQEIQGRVTSFDGAYDLAVRDNNGYIDNVSLHDGTIINPVGLSLAPGMIVSILGSNAGNAFDADEIDTPYTFDDAVPYYAGHPWDYYGPSVELSFFFGNTGWWHGGGRGIAYADRGRERVTERRDVTNVDRTRQQTPVDQPSRSNAIALRTNGSVSRIAAAPRTFTPVIAPRMGSSIGSARTFDNVPPQRTSEHERSAERSAPSRGHR